MRLRCYNNRDMGRRKQKKSEPYLIEDLVLEKFVNGGQALGYFGKDFESKPVFVWGGIAGETVDVLVAKSRKGILEGVIQKVKVTPSLTIPLKLQGSRKLRSTVSKSPKRVVPKSEDEYLSTSPWQILDFAFENETKLNLLKQTFKYEAGIDLDENYEVEMFAGSAEYGYRNKMEYNFWGDEDGIHLALHKRGSGQKIKLKGSVLASDAINKSGEDLIAKLNSLNIFAGDLKSLILRSNQKGEVVGALFVKKEDFKEFEVPKSLKGLVCYYSNPKSPASVITKELWRGSFGYFSSGESAQDDSLRLVDSILGKELAYDVNSFFQVNIAVFEEALKDIKKFLDPKLPTSPAIPLELEDARRLRRTRKIVDFYGGVGSIGISVAGENYLEIVELDEHSSRMAKENIAKLPSSLKLRRTGKNASVVNLPAEDSLEKIVQNCVLIVDPPRAGLHKKVVQRIVEAKPKQLIYLSCNPVTQARDLKEILEAGYEIKFSRGYNFFPKTPHIESLIILEKAG